jgi:hypothetical protein
MQKGILVYSENGNIKYACSFNSKNEAYEQMVKEYLDAYNKSQTTCFTIKIPPSIVRWAAFLKNIDSYDKQWYVFWFDINNEKYLLVKQFNHVVSVYYPFQTKELAANALKEAYNTVISSSKYDDSVLLETHAYVTGAAPNNYTTRASSDFVWDIVELE